MKIIAIIIVKNDAWFVGKTIEHLRFWADEIIIDDDSSDDGSEKIFAKYKGINNIHHIIRPKGQSFITPERRNYMLSLAREFDGSNLIFEIHADEIMSAEILKPDIRNRFLDRVTIGSAIMMPWVNLWKDPLYYRNDNSVWSGNRTWFAYRDDRKEKFEGVGYHGSRAPESFLQNRVDIDFLQVMHYQFVNLAMERSKQALYQIFEKNHYPNKNVEYINKTYACAFDERKVSLVKLEDKHYVAWIEKGISIDKKYPTEGYNWRDTEVLKNFDRNGLDIYKNLNIWYIDWEKKRQESIGLGITDLPEEEIIDPRDLSTKLAHKYLMKYQRYPIWRFGFYKLLVEKAVEKINKRMSS